MYKHDAIVRAWLDGKPIQFKLENKWLDVGPATAVSFCPAFWPHMEHRIKPKPVIKKYRCLVQHRQSGRHEITNFHYKDQMDYENTSGNSHTWEFIRIIEETLMETEGEYGDE